ncbi:MAG TPA: hypothetical protein VGD69_29000 [Herpetosiphonaceae bacterium]
MFLHVGDEHQIMPPQVQYFRRWYRHRRHAVLAHRSSTCFLDDFTEVLVTPSTLSF